MGGGVLVYKFCYINADYKTFLIEQKVTWHKLLKNKNIN